MAHVFKHPLGKTSRENLIFVFWCNLSLGIQNCPKKEGKLKTNPSNYTFFSASFGFFIILLLFFFFFFWLAIVAYFIYRVAGTSGKWNSWSLRLTDEEVVLDSPERPNCPKNPWCTTPPPSLSLENFIFIDKSLKGQPPSVFSNLF